MCVCLCVCVCVYIYIYTHTHTRIYLLQKFTGLMKPYERSDLN